MSPTPQSSDSQDSILFYLQQTTKNISETVVGLDCKFDKFQMDYIRAHVELEGKMQNAAERLDEHDRDIKELQQQVKKMADSLAPLILTNKILTWISGAVGISVIALIWGILTHSVTLLIP